MTLSTRKYDRPQQHCALGYYFAQVAYIDNVLLNMSLIPQADYLVSGLVRQ